MISQALGQAFKRPIRSRGSSMVSVRMTYRPKPFFPAPLPGINEENLVRIRQCAGCRVRYAVFGEHRFCPACGPLPPEVVALDALGATSTARFGQRLTLTEADCRRAIADTTALCDAITALTAPPP